MPQVVPNPYMNQVMPAFGTGGYSGALNRLPVAVQQQIMKARQAQAVQNMPAGLNPQQKEAYAAANHIPAASLGLTNDQINSGEQANMGQVWSNKTGGMVSTTDPNNAYGRTSTPTGAASTIGQPIPTTTTSPAVAPNPYGGAAGLAGSGGNALRQQMMDSGQFNPNGANTYAIQNLDMSGQGASIDQNGNAVPAATPTSTVPAATPAPAVPGVTPPGTTPPPPGSSGAPVGATNNPYVPSAGLGGGNHSVIQGGTSGGINGNPFTGAIAANTGVPGVGTGANYVAGTPAVPATQGAVGAGSGVSTPAANPYSTQTQATGSTPVSAVGAVGANPYTGALGQSGQSAPVLNHNGGGGLAPNSPVAPNATLPRATTGMGMRGGSVLQ